MHRMLYHFFLSMCEWRAENMKERESLLARQCVVLDRLSGPVLSECDTSRGPKEFNVFCPAILAGDPIRSCHVIIQF
jgi:hypothetical protein